MMSNESQSLTLSSRQGETRKLLWLLIIFFGSIILYQYFGLPDSNFFSSAIDSDWEAGDTSDQWDKANKGINSSSSSSSPVVKNHEESPITIKVPPPCAAADISSALLSPPVSDISVPPPSPKSEIPPKFSSRKIYTFREMGEKLAEGRRSTHSPVPLWPTKADQELVYAKSEIENAVYDSDHHNDDGLYAPIYRNITAFRRSYELMEKTLKVYVYKEGDKPIFHQPHLQGTYASEGWFMKNMESSKKFVTQNPDKAHLFYLPFSSRWLRATIPNSPHKRLMSQHLQAYLDLIAAKHPSWNRTGGYDHFFTACHDWSEQITRSIMSTCIRAICDADMYKSFIFGKDISLPTTRILTKSNPLFTVGGDPPSSRKTLAFFAGKPHGYVRPILFHHWENTDPDIKVFGGSTLLNGTEAYNSYMRGSKYCICPRGYEAFGPRFMEAIYSECVPVIVSDNYIPPLFDVLDWDSFAVFVPEKDITKLKQVLMEIPDERYLEMHKRVKMVQRHFLWRDRPVKYDAFHMVLHSVWYNRVSLFQSA